ncbi:hypothetical protein LAZ67_8001511, partial [Cordylochernes scorpioides]
MCLANVFFFLSGTAKVWFENVEEQITSWELFETMLSQAFGHHASEKDQVLEKLKARAQGKGESSEAYIQDVLYLCRQINPNMNENEKVAHLVKGVSEEIYRAIVTFEIATTEEFIRWCRKIELSQKKRVNTRIVFDRLPNAAAINPAESESMEDLIRRIVREEIYHALNPEPATLKPSSLDLIIREEVERNLSAISQPVQRSMPRQQYSNRPQIFKQTPRQQFLNQRPPVPNQTSPQRRTDECRTHENVPICFHCGRPGHVARYCRDRRRVFEEARVRRPTYTNNYNTWFNQNAEEVEFVDRRFRNPHHIILGLDFFRATSAVIDCGRGEIHLKESVNDGLEEDLPTHALEDCFVPARSIKKISVINEDIRGGKDLMIEGSKDLILKKELVIPSSIINFHHGRGEIWVTNGISQNQIIPADERLNEEQKSMIAECLEKYSEVFDFDRKSFSTTSNVKHKIDTSDSRPIKQRPYRVSPVERRAIQSEVDKMIKMGIVQPSESPWSSPVVLVKKKDGSWRFCVDYRKLNRVTKKDVYPLPRNDGVLDSLTGAKFFSSMDLRTGYWQIEIDEEDREKTAFITPDGLYEFRVMPFGLCNAPATFERMMDKLLAGLKWTICLCFLDDIIVYATSFKEHIERLGKVLRCIQQAGLCINHEKCRFGSREIKVLGHLVTESGIRPDPDKIEAITNFPTPKTTTEVRSFMGLCSYYRRFVKDFANKAKPLHDLLRNNVKFFWSNEQEQSFQILKSALTTDPVLGHFKEDAETLVHTDASGYGVGAAVVWAIYKFRPYLFGKHFTVVSDHHSLCWLANVKDPSGRLARWALRLQEFDISMVYKNGKRHQDADCLSRSPLPQSNEDNIPELSSITDIRKEQRSDVQTKKIIQEIDSKSESGYKIIDRILYRKNYDPMGKPWLLVVPKQMRVDILSEAHDAPMAGHLGFAKTYDRVRRKYFWPGLPRSVRQYVAHCRECQRRKSSTERPPGQLVPIPPVSRPFEKIGIDLLGRFPISNDGNKWTVVATDYLTRYAMTKAIPNGSSEEVGKFIVEDVILKHGAPRELISDRDQRNWDSVLPYVTFAYNTAKQETTGFSPFYLVHGRDVETPLDTILTYREEANLEDYVESLVTNAEDARQLARLNILKAQEKDKSRYDKSHRPVQYRTEDLVWVYTPVRKQGLSEKLLKRYFGPYKVVRQLSEVTYEVEALERRPRQRNIKDIVHVLRMNPYRSPEEQTQGNCEDYDPNYKKDRPNQNTSVKQVCGAPELLNVSTLTNTPTQGAFKLINISVEVNGIPAQAFVDTGATVSIINWRLFKRTRLQLQPNSDIHISQADGVTRTCGSLQTKLIRISDSPWAFPVVMVSKKDGNKRMCIDYRRLNEITLDDRQTLPHIQDMFDRLHGSRFFSTLDVAWGFWQIEMDPQSIQKTAFVTNDGHYEFLVMPFGLKNAASTFQRIIQHILGELLWKGTCSFQDDILVYTKTWQEHIELLSKVFDKLRQYNMKLKLSKCIFGRAEVKYLGDIISHNQLKPDPGKVKSIQDFSRPDTVMKVRQFMGLANYYRKFVKDFSKISFPLVRLTRKNQPFIWNEEVEESFAKLKMALSTKPVLAIYNPDYPSKVYTDASKYGIGAILTQIGPDNEEHVIAYYSKTLQPHQENYSAYEMECLAVIQATDHFHVYIENQPFEIITDHAALQWLFTMNKPKPKYFRWILSLSSKSCNIVHRSGKQQTHVDALSRLPVVNIATQELQEHQQNSDLSFLKNSHTHDGVVMIKQKGVFKAVVPNLLTKKILEEYHDSLSHPSITKTCKLITQCYWWKGITTDIKNYVRSCKSCQLVKVRHEPTLGEMITPTSNIQPLQMIGCDTIVLGTAATNTKHKFIQVFVDHATRYLWAYPTITNTAQAVTQCLDKIIKSVNSINTILTDNGKNFISKEFNKFLSLQGIKHTYTSPYHPQCNGICEKLNDTIMTKLRIAVLEKPRCKWSSLLPQVVKNYNSTPPDVTGFSPLFLMYGNGNVPEFADQTPITIEEARKKASLRTEQIR